jgi:hypothetical protein
VTATVETFLDDVRSVLDGAANDLGCEWPATVDVMLKAVRSEHRLPREGRLPSGVRYSVHGAGCRFSTRKGVEVDLDNASGGQAVVFDIWRVRHWAASRRLDPPPDEELKQELSALVERGVLTPRGDWFWEVAR